MTTYYIEKAPGDAATSDTGAVEKIQVQDSTDQEKNQEIEKLERFISLYREMVRISGSGEGQMVLGVDMFSDSRIQLGSRWFFDNVTEYTEDADWDADYASCWTNLSDVTVFCLVEKEGL